MSRKYKFYNKEGLYFVSFAIVHWIDVFVREPYFAIITENLTYCRRHKGLRLYCWCIMPSHIHLIFSAEQGNPGAILRDFKKFTSKKLQQQIASEIKESRRSWMLKFFKEEGTKNSNVQDGQFWQQHNHPIELTNNFLIDQKVDYIHFNPVKAGFVSEAHHWKYSSAIDYSGGKGMIDIDLD